MLANGSLPPHMANNITQAAFILITLLFPIVGGVCFSMGLDRWLNWTELIAARANRKACRERFIESEEELVGTEAQLEKINSYISWVGSKAFFRKYLDHLLACYAIGYERGQLAPDSNMNVKGYFEMVTRMRRKIVSRQVFNTIRAANKNPDGSILERFDEKAKAEFAAENDQEPNTENHKPDENEISNPE